MTSRQRFHAALAHIAETFPPEVATRALGAWHLICAKVDPPEPIIGGEDGVCVTFAWSAEDRYLDLEAYRDGFEWFYDGRRARRDCEGTVDKRDATIPDAFFTRLAEFGGPPRETEAELRALYAEAAWTIENADRAMAERSFAYHDADRSATLDLIERLRKAGAP